MIELRLLLSILLGTASGQVPAGLRPVQSETRWMMSLAGVWRGRIDPLDAGKWGRWYATGLPAPLMDLPVPASVQELETVSADLPEFAGGVDREKGLQEYIDAVWYERTLWVPAGWWGKGRSLSLRFDGVTTNADVYANGQGPLASHRGIALPFSTGDLSSVVGPGGELKVVVRTDAHRTWADVPPGRMVNDSWGRSMVICGDGFPAYTGIDRSVWLVSIPAAPSALSSVRAWTVSVPEKDGGEAVMGWDADAEGCSGCPVSVSLLDADGREAARGEGKAGGKGSHYTVKVPNATLWEAAPGNPHLYTAVFSLNGTLDVYRMKVGIRTVTTSGSKLLLNGRPVYLRGADIHSNSPLFGAAYDASGAMVTRDTNLLRDLGANSFRMNSWPPPEEVLDMCDKYGFLIQDETPGIGLTTWDPKCPEVFQEGCADMKTLETHKRITSELIARDSSRASVGIWSLANEPSSNKEGAVAYFSSLLNATKGLDPQSRPITFVTSQRSDSDLVHKALPFDLICVNRYFGWYSSTPNHWEAATADLNGPAPLGLVSAELEHDLRGWNSLYPGVPVVLSEYGAGAASGWHDHVPRMYTEEFQVALLQQDHAALDAVRSDFLVGEHVHAFHDFRQGLSRPNAELGMNFKGLHTHDRKPKASAALIRDRYHKIAMKEEGKKG